MGWEYTNSDRALARQFRMRLSRYAYHNIPITGCATTAGGVESRTGTPENNGGGKDHSKTVDIEFQFPPKVLNDSRKGNWFEGDLTGGKEPVAAFKTSGPRTITLAWSYVIDSFNDSPTNGWTIERVTRQVRTLRGYFATSRGQGAERNGLVIGFQMWCIGGDRQFTGRITNIEVKYGETMVFPPNTPDFPSGGSDRAFPLRTDITVDFRLWSKGASSNYADDAEEKPEIHMQDLDALQPYAPPSWF